MDRAAVGTPLIRLGRLSLRPLFLKAEHLQPSGSVYDRVAWPLLRSFDGKEHAPAIVAGSGSLGLAFAMVADAEGIPLTVVCAESTLPEHLELIAQHRAKVVLSARDKGLLGTHEVAVEEQKAHGGRLVHSPRCWEKTAQCFERIVGHELGSLLLELAPPKPLGLVAPIGVGALLTGVARGVRAKGIDLKTLGTVLAEDNSLQENVLRAEEAPSVADLVVPVWDAMAFEMRARLAQKEGILVGPGSAGAMSAAFDALERGELASAIVVAVDAGDRYFSRDHAWEARGLVGGV